MVTTEQQMPGGATAAQRWLARLALVAAAAAVLVPLLAIGFRASLAVVVTGVVGLALTAAGVWWALTNKGVVRWLAVALAVAGAAGGAGPVHEPGAALGGAGRDRAAGRWRWLLGGRRWLGRWFPSGWSSMMLRHPGGRS